MGQLTFYGHITTFLEYTPPKSNCMPVIIAKRFSFFPPNQTNEPVNIYGIPKNRKKQVLLMAFPIPEKKNN